MDDIIDMKLYKHFENIEVPDRLDNIIEKSITKKRRYENKIYNFYGLKVASIFIIFILVGSIVFANYIIELFANTHQGVVRALENGYIAKIDMDYVYSNETGIKIDSVMMDEYNILMTVTLKMQENINNINHIEIPDLMITDENDNIIFCDYANIKGYEDYCKRHKIDYSKKNMKNNYTNNGYATEVLKKEKNQITFVYKLYSRGYPKSKKLNINFKEINLKENAIEVPSITKKGVWKISIDLPEEFYNRDISYYTVKDGSDEKNNIKITYAVVSNTEMKISFESIINKYNELGEDNLEKKVENKMQDLLNGKGVFYNDIEVENEKGEKFKRTQVTDTDGTTYSVLDGSVRGSATFSLTKYDMSDNIKLRMYRDNKEIIINLTRKND